MSPKYNDQLALYPVPAEDTLNSSFDSSSSPTSFYDSFSSAGSSPYPSHPTNLAVFDPRSTKSLLPGGPDRKKMKRQRKRRAAAGAVSGAIFGGIIGGPIGAVAFAAAGGAATRQICKRREKKAVEKYDASMFSLTAGKSAVHDAVVA
eukprot:CAMPEP_0194036110 /NCGR_PEP_ID=MMETSP0009_2-20130614/8492_1 /TAXON_ID=210454 /ORGANISM="Grammatophora oceanica, Strain CCMP 410" /LENGTH=147 /DNA_ID=CAMNT_0038677725 /DNA_START=128 /DNA_END=571 /DNA_ORIENTATION=-